MNDRTLEETEAMIHSQKNRRILCITTVSMLLAAAGAALDPVLVRNLDFGPGSSSPCDFVSVGGQQLFSASDSSGRELWRTNGTYLTTQRVKDIFNSGVNSSNPSGFFVFTSPILGEIALFTARDSTSGYELWRSDGTTAGTQRVADLNPGSGPSGPTDYVFVPTQDKVYFRAFNGTESRLYQTDGVNTSLLTTLHMHGAQGSIATLGGNLFVSALEPVSQVGELIRIDLPAATWQVVADINAGGGSYPSNLTTVGSSIYMAAYTNAAGREPYVTDGSIGNLVSLGDLQPGPQNGGPMYFTPFAGWVYFTSSAGLVRTQGTLATTSVVLAGFDVSGPLIDTGGLLYAPAFVNGIGYEPYVTDGTTVTLVEDINPGAGSSVPQIWQAANIDGRLVFSADDGVHGIEPWESSDGTPAGTDILADLEPGATSSNAACFRDFGSYGLMGATQSPFGHEPFALVSTAYDFGDAPDTYGTALAGDGARHALGSGLYLGSIVDAELDRPYDIGALADDSEGFDDEDGVAFTLNVGSLPLLAAGEPINLDVTASIGGKLDAWIDFNADGDFLDLGEKLLFTDVEGDSVVAGVNLKTFQMPSTLTPGVSYARFRVTGTGTASPTGSVNDGEVEDYFVILSRLDFGDAPDPSYPTLRDSDGARHGAYQGPRLGGSLDADSDGQPSPTANGDDIDGTDDEDGVTLPTMSPGQMASVNVEVSDFSEVADSSSGGGNPILNAWIDFNQDGDWDDSGEHILQDQAVSYGSNMLPVAVPGTAALGTTLARFRLSTTSGLAPTGLAADGEVEDHPVTLAVVEADLQISKTDGLTTAAPGGEITYTIVASNPGGPNDAFGSRVVDDLPVGLNDCTIQCSPSGGASCSPEVLQRLAGAALDQLVDLPISGVVTFTVTCTVDTSASGTLTNTATVAVPAGMTDPVPENNSATDIDSLIPEGDLSITKTDGLAFVVPPASLTYTILAENPGPSHAFGALLVDALPAEVDNVTWTCIGSDGGACVASGNGDISQSVDLPAGAAVTFTVVADVVATPPAVVENTATISPPGGFVDPNSGNDSATDITNVEVDGAIIFFDGFETGDTSEWDLVDGETPGGLLFEPSVQSLDLTILLDSHRFERTGKRLAGLLTARSRRGHKIFSVEVETRDGRFRLVPSLLTAEEDWVRGDAVWLDQIPSRIHLAWRRQLAGDGQGALYLLHGEQILSQIEGVHTSGARLRTLQTHNSRRGL
jgi:uncharacterized repeat protein (TIGR01451 family)